MIPIKKALTSQVGLKFIMALTGLGLVFFTITHLIGNLNLLRSDGEVFNGYAQQLASFGPLLWAAEIGLLIAALLHVVTALSLKKGHLSARPDGYRKLQSKGAPSRSGLAANYMIVSGCALLAFLIWHVIQFKFGPSIAEGYVTQLHGQEARDLHRLVVETFQSPIWTGVYVFAMAFLGFHLRHGFWSAFQSLGAMSPKLSPLISLIGVLVALVLAIGFVFIPLFIHFRG